MAEREEESIEGKGKGGRKNGEGKREKVNED